MPSFDIVSEFDKHELANAVDQANREVTTRFDFKGSGATFKYEGEDITMKAEADFQLNQMLDVLHTKMAKRGVDVSHLKPQHPVIQHKNATQAIKLQEGIEKEMAKKVIKLIKDDKKLKVQAAIQGNQIRVTGKKRDDLQAVIAMLREADLDLPLQFENFRD